MKKLLLFGFLIVSVLSLAAALRADTLSVPHAAFIVVSGIVDYRDQGYLRPGSPSTWVQAPVNLPHGAIIDGIKVFYYDNGQYEWTVKLVRQKLLLGTKEVMFSVVTPDASDQIRAITDYSLDTATWRSVYAPNQSYWFDVTTSGIGDEYRLYAVQVIYHMPTT